MRGLIAAARALCSATGGPQPSGQSASFKLCLRNYSGMAPADTIIKSVSERPNGMFPPGNHVRARQTSVTLSSEPENLIFPVSENISEFLKYFQNF